MSLVIEKWLDRIRGVLLCSWLGHKRNFRVWLGRYNPKHCRRCGKHISEW
jgi:hypothetical protein